MSSSTVGSIFRIDDPVRLLGDEERHRSVFDDDSLHFVEIEREVVVAFAFDDRSTGDAAEMAVQRIGRFKAAALRPGPAKVNSSVCKTSLNRWRRRPAAERP